MISPEVKSFDSFVARMGEGKGQILTPSQATFWLMKGILDSYI
jgi:hypothetical protein